VQARNIIGSASATISLTISNGAIISPTSAPGVVGAPFNYLIVANNNPTGFSASSMPSGLSCDVGSGLISGIPVQNGTFPVYVQARNVFGSASATISLTISNGAITSATSVQGVIGVPFNYEITANNNPTGYSTSGLPSGLSCDVGSGLILGTPVQAGTFPVYVEAKNIFGSASATISMTISPGTIGTASQPTLTFLRTGNSVLLSWPVTSDGFVLEVTQLQPNAWTNSSVPVVVQGSNNVAAIATAGTAKFYRLRK
jgi:Putative Ig domain